MNKYTYNFEALQLYIKENKIILNNDYSDQKVTRDTIIEGKCIEHNCSNNFKKSFRQLKISEGFCNNCCKIKQKEKTKKKFIEKYGYDNPFKSPEIINKIKKTNFEKYGCENPLQSELVNEKRKQSNMIKYGVPYAIQSKEIRKKISETNLLNYGYENVFKSPECINKIKKTNIIKYGCENPSQNPLIINKILQKYHEKSIEAINSIIEKRKNTTIKRYGVNHQMLLDETKNKIRQTCIKKYGVENPQQNPEIAEKASKNSYRKKIYILPSGKEIICQGYEPLALDKLVKEENLLEDDIITGCKNMPTIWYKDKQDKKHRHYVDIFIPSQNRCIEVKSTWTAEKKKDNIYLKQEAAKQLGYKYEIWIYNAKKELVEVKT